MNAAAILALISNLYEQVAALQAENEQLRAALAEKAPDGTE
jgi:uncharacterized small protein (DUF1192 family)